MLGRKERQSTGDLNGVSGELTISVFSPFSSSSAMDSPWTMGSVLGVVGADASCGVDGNDSHTSDVAHFPVVILIHRAEIIDYYRLARLSHRFHITVPAQLPWNGNSSRFRISNLTTSYTENHN